MFCSDSYSLGLRIFSCFLFFSLLVPSLTVRTAAAKTILALMEERVTRPVTSSGNVSGVNAVRMLQETSVKLVRMQSIRPIRSRGGSRGRVQGVYPPPPDMTCGFLIQLVFCKLKTMRFIGVEVEQETSAPPPKKTPGSAPEECRGR